MINNNYLFLNYKISFMNYLKIKYFFHNKKIYNEIIYKYSFILKKKNIDKKFHYIYCSLKILFIKYIKNQNQNNNKKINYLKK